MRSFTPMSKQSQHTIPRAVVLCVFALPAPGVLIGEYTAAVLAMTFNLDSYAVEILRSGIDAVPRGHREAAAVLTMSPRETFVHVLSPQAFEKLFPVLTSQIVISARLRRRFANLRCRHHVRDELRSVAQFPPVRNVLPDREHLPRDGTRVRTVLDAAACKSLARNPRGT